VVVLSDDKTASKKISSFATSGDRWMVAVRMVSEGVDIPRLAVGVYATSVSTALFFAQAVGRFVRARQRGETASVFLPSVPVLLSYAAELEAERDHVLRSPHAETPEEEDLLAEAQRQRDTPDTPLEPAFQPLNASAHFDRVLTSSACPACWNRTRSGRCSASVRTPRSPPAPTPPNHPPLPHRPSLRFPQQHRRSSRLHHR
jgi:superfamily II DNA or RNA helicase